jgi:hypothetical protein
MLTLSVVAAEGGGSWEGEKTGHPHTSYTQAHKYMLTSTYARISTHTHNTYAYATYAPLPYEHSSTHPQYSLHICPQNSYSGLMPHVLSLSFPLAFFSFSCCCCCRRRLMPVNAPLPPFHPFISFSLCVLFICCCCALCVLCVVCCRVRPPPSFPLSLGVQGCFFLLLLVRCT